MLLTFQALTWELHNKRPTPFKRKGPKLEKHQYEDETQVIHCCGRTEDGRSVHVAIMGYHPYFYVRASHSDFMAVVSKFQYTWAASSRTDAAAREDASTPAQDGGAVGEHCEGEAQEGEAHQRADDVAARGGWNKRGRTSARFEEWWVHEARVVERQVYQGFRNGKKDAMLRVTAANQACMRDMLKALSETQKPDGTPYELFDSRQDVLCSFYHEHDIDPCGWLTVDEALDLEMDDMPFGYDASRCEEDYVVLAHGLRTVRDKTDVAPFIVCSIDIEAFAPLGPDGKYPFPDPKLPSHKMSCVCVKRRTLTQSATEGEYVYFSYRPLDTDRLHELCIQEGLSVNHRDSAVCTSERDMLARFVAYFAHVGFDIIIGWNTLNFDMRYIYGRCALLGVSLVPMGKWGDKATARGPKLQELTLSTAGAGHNHFVFWHLPGVFQMDELVVVRRDKKFDSYKLGSVAQRVLGDTKMDEPPDEIHRKSQGTPVELAEIVAYCMKDTLLPDAIAVKLQSYMKSFMFANIATVPVSYLLTRGANIKTASFILKHVRRRHMVISNATKPFNRLVGKYEGATVLDAVKGFYDDPVATLDFKSLYPSIFISQCLDPQAFVESEEYLGLPNVRYKCFRWVDRKSAQQFSYWMVTNGHELGCPAVIPEIMEELWNERDRAKACMKRAATSVEKSVYDGIQLAVKLLMNSIYGFFGALTSSPVPHLPLAMICTYMGRTFIEASQKFVIARYGTFRDERIERMGCEERMGIGLTELSESCTTVVNVYGDSVIDTTPILVRWIHTGMAITTMDVLAAAQQWHPSINGKEYCTPEGLYAWTDAHWTPITTMVRHRANKPILRVWCTGGCVAVTADHSLLSASGIKVAPRELNVGDELLHNWPQPDAFIASTRVTKALARIYGLFCGTGMCAEACPSGFGEAVWYVSSSDRKMLQAYRTLCVLHFEMPFVIERCERSARVHRGTDEGWGMRAYRLAPVTRNAEDLASLVAHFAEACYDCKGRKKVPDVMLRVCRKERTEFLAGLYDAIGRKTHQARMTLATRCVFLHAVTEARGDECRMTHLEDALALGTYAMASSIGLHVSIQSPACDFEDGCDLNHLVLCFHEKAPKRTASACSVLSVQRIAYGAQRYVYDLTTGNHQFHAGVGGLIVHNTDSIFVKWDVSAEARRAGQTAVLEEVFAQSELAAKEITDHLLRTHCPTKRRVEMEFEKVYYSLISYSKKRYAGLLWTRTDRADYIDYKGVQIVRRDTPLILKTLLTRCIEKILVDKDKEGAIALVRQTFERIADGGCEPHEFAKTGAVSDRQYAGALPPAAVVAGLLRARGLMVPDRVAYVYVVGDPKARASTRVDVPEHVAQCAGKSGGLRVDVHYYMTNQFRKPILELLSPALDGLEALVDEYTLRLEAQVSGEQRQHRREAEQRQLGVKPITFFFQDGR